MALNSDIFSIVNSFLPIEQEAINKEHDLFIWNLRIKTIFEKFKECDSWIFLDLVDFDIFELLSDSEKDIINCAIINEPGWDLLINEVEWNSTVLSNILYENLSEARFIELLKEYLSEFQILELYKRFRRSFTEKEIEIEY